MTNKYEPPKWYPLITYDKDLTPEEWLQEIYKRSWLDEYLINPFLSSNERLHMFKSVILENELLDIRPILRSELNKPIRDISIAEVLYLAEMIKQAPSYQANSETQSLETTILKKVQGQPLSVEEKNLFASYYDKPWHSFLHLSSEDTRYPRIPYLMGAPVTINAYFTRQDIISQLENKLNHWTDKKLPTLTPKTLSTWTQRKILAIFDLLTWLKIHNIEIPKIQLARLLWSTPPPSKKCSDSTVVLQKYYDYSLQLAKDTIHFGTVSLLFLTCENRKFQQEREDTLKEQFNT